MAERAKKWETVQVRDYKGNKSYTTRLTAVWKDPEVSGEFRGRTRDRVDNRPPPDGCDYYQFPKGMSVRLSRRVDEEGAFAGYALLFHDDCEVAELQRFDTDVGDTYFRGKVMVDFEDPKTYGFKLAEGCRFMMWRPRADSGPGKSGAAWNIFVESPFFERSDEGAFDEGLEEDDYFARKPSAKAARPSGEKPFGTATEGNEEAGPF